MKALWTQTLCHLCANQVVNNAVMSMSTSVDDHAQMLQDMFARYLKQ